MGKPAQFPIDDLGKTPGEKLDVGINEMIAPLVEGRGTTIEVNLDGRCLLAGSINYQNGSDGLPRRQLFVLKDSVSSDPVAYMDLGLDCKNRLAVCGDMRSLNAPADLGNLSRLSPYNDGFACGTDTKAGNLLIGLALYTLRLGGISALKITECNPSDDDNDAFGSEGPKKSDFTSRIYTDVTPEIRVLVAESLRVTPEY